MSATLSKKEKKALRKQMMQRKQELLAKHGSPGSSNSGKRPGDSGAYRTFSDVKPKLPTYTPPKRSEPVKPSKPSKPSRTRVSWRDRVKPVVTTKTPPAPKPARTFSPKLAQPKPQSRSVAATHPSRPVPPATPVAVASPHGLTPGLLQRSAARIEAGAARIAALRRWRPPRIPWEKFSVDATAPTFGTLRSMVWPMRLCGIVAVGGAAKLALEAHAAGFTPVAASLVFGLGVAVAVGVLALAEIGRVLHHLGRAA
ncbi:MAG: hypothetical protein AAGF84_10390 [Planctomycetota bacterium]